MDVILLLMRNGRILLRERANTGYGDGAYEPDVRWFPVGDLPTNMLDRARVALRNYADGMRFSTYPAFDPAGTGQHARASSAILSCG